MSRVGRLRCRLLILVMEIKALGRRLLWCWALEPSPQPDTHCRRLSLALLHRGSGGQANEAPIFN